MGRTRSFRDAHCKQSFPKWLQWLFFFVCIHSTYGSGEENNRALVIPLKTTSSSIGYVAECKWMHSPFAPSYGEKLRSVLVFDLIHAGLLDIKPSTSSLSKALHNHQRFLPLFWKQQGIDFVVKIKGEKKTISCELFSTRTGIQSTFSSSLLTGNLAKDRRAIHSISDQICKEITDLPGIASTKILYVVKQPYRGEGTENLRSDIWEIDYDGHNNRQITKENTYCTSPKMFPSTSRRFSNKNFLYVNYKNASSKLYTFSSSTKTSAPFLSFRGNQLLPAISKQGHLVAFISDATGRVDLFVQPIDHHRNPRGKPIQVYSFPSSVQASPTFSPDGSKIAFVSDKEGTPNVYLISTPSLKRTNHKTKRKISLQRLTKKYRENTSPCWSPDGKKLAYSAKIKGTRQIMIYNFETGQEEQLTTGKNHKENPSFAPNSLHLVFQTVDSSSELFVVDLKRKKTMQITRGTGGCSYPNWMPHAPQFERNQ